MESLRSKIAQMLIIGFSGLEINEESTVVRWLKEDHLGGVILFDYDLHKKCYGKNIQNKSQVKTLNQQLKQYSAHHPLPLFIAIDYEGGKVDRLAQIPDCIVTMKACEQVLLTEEAFIQEIKKMALQLDDLGFNLNFAPVVDLNLNENAGIIGKLGRSFSFSPEIVARTANQFVNVFSEFNIACAYKHFPGHGSALGDTHEGFVDVTDHFQMSELQPYEILLRDTVHPVMVMTAHVVNRQLDKTGLPATLSYPILNDLLRKKIGFDGVVISDDLQMQAISNHYTLEESLQLTINAGADMIIFGNQLGEHDAKEVIDQIEILVNSGKIKPARIEEAYQRIVKLKNQLIKNNLK